MKSVSRFSGTGKIPGDGRMVEVIEDPTKAFAHGSGFSVAQFVTGINGWVWPIGMIVKRGDTVSKIVKKSGELFLEVVPADTDTDTST